MIEKLAIEFNDVYFSYKNERFIEALNFHILAGEFISIIGPSGSGKSTLFRLITGLEEPKQGTISIHNHQYKSRFGTVGYMPQQDLLMPWRTILENGLLPLEIQKVPKQQAQKQVRDLMRDFGLAGYEEAYPKDLSGGMRQRVSFLRASLSGSNVLLLDEPFSALDAITKISMQEWLLKQWEKRQQTTLFITHDVDEALFLSDRIFVLTDKPIQSLEEVRVPLGRPRIFEQLQSPPIAKLKQQLLDTLRQRELS